jgi:POT family proton-dependent oligopeptide transporter
MILILAPLFSYYLYPKLNKITKLTDLKKISIGLFLAVPSFIIIGLVEKWITLGYTPSIGWQVFAYIILTASEVLVSITCLEFSYTQSPNFMKSLIMGFFLLSVSIGNIFTVWINNFMIINNITYSQSYYNFYAFLMLITASIFLLVVKFYRPNYYINSEE